VKEDEILSPLTPFSPYHPCAAKLTKFQHDLKKKLWGKCFVLDITTYELYENIREYFMFLWQKKGK